jgi:hypothetical protein
VESSENERQSEKLCDLYSLAAVVALRIYKVSSAQIATSSLSGESFAAGEVHWVQMGLNAIQESGTRNLYCNK